MHKRVFFHCVYTVIYSMTRTAPDDTATREREKEKRRRDTQYIQ